MRVILHTPLSQWSGYGRDGIGLAQALMDMRHDVWVSPAAVDVPLPRDIAGKLTERIGSSADLALHHCEPNKARLGASDARVARTNVLWTMWGWPDLPDEPWVEQFAANVARFDYVVAYDPVSAQAFAPFVEPDRLLTLQGGYSAGEWGRPSEPVPDHRFTFGMVGRLTVRKGVYDAFQAFCELQEEKDDFDAQLVLISTEPVFPEQVTLPPGVKTVVDRYLPEELRPLYHGMDTLLAPSMAEAKHLPPIESLSCGTPVILSDIPGHRTWATGDLVTWVPTVDRTVLPGYTGGAVDLEALKHAMWLHYTTPAPQRRKAELAARTLPAMLDWAKCLHRLGLNIGIPL